MHTSRLLGIAFLRSLTSNGSGWIVQRCRSFADPATADRTAMSVDRVTSQCCFRRKRGAIITAVSNLNLPVRSQVPINGRWGIEKVFVSQRHLPRCLGIGDASRSGAESGTNNGNSGHRQRIFGDVGHVAGRPSTQPAKPGPYQYRTMQSKNGNCSKRAATTSTLGKP
jgi:hypothetical protein